MIKGTIPRVPPFLPMTLGYLGLPGPASVSYWLEKGTKSSAKIEMSF